MNLEQLKAFLEQIKNDSNLQEKLKAANSSEEIKDIAKEHGHEFNTDMINQLSEEELEGLAGGGISIWGCTECVRGTLHCKRCDMSNLF